MTVKIEEINRLFVEDGYKLLSTDYVNSDTKLDFICPEGHSHNISWHNWKTGYRCGRCKGNVEVNIDDIFESFNRDGYKLLSTEYMNNRQKLDYICPEGHQHNISWANWISGYRCGVCFGTPKLSVDDIRNSFAQKGYILLTTEYQHNKQKLEFVCPKGHQHHVKWNGWHDMYECPYCSGRIVNISIVRESFENEGYTLLSTEYVNSVTKLDFICPQGHEHQVSWSVWRKGHRCAICAFLSQTSKPEKEILEYVRSVYHYEVLENDRTVVINPNTGSFLELDIYLPDTKNAIEFNGDYWHSFDKAKKHDKIKSDRCDELGISLLTITESEWSDDIDSVKNDIKVFLGI